jgi:hypothetical protein
VRKPWWIMASASVAVKTRVPCPLETERNLSGPATRQCHLHGRLGRFQMSDVLSSFTKRLLNLPLVDEASNWEQNEAGPNSTRQAANPRTLRPAWCRTQGCRFILRYLALLVGTGGSGGAGTAWAPDGIQTQ